MSRYKLFILFALQCSLILFVVHYHSPPQHLHSQTIPSPTPIVAATDTSVPPTATTAITTEPTATNDDGGNNPPPNNTAEPGSTPTFTPIPGSTFAPTPAGGFLPTARPCEDAPTIQAFNNLNVRQGPGTDYDMIDLVVFLEVRPIIGRSRYDSWWLIELADGTSGWVADATGLAQGYIGNVPIVPAPPLAGETPTPGPTWQPTPRATCTVTPTFTPSATATPTPTPSATSTATAVLPTATVTPTPTLASTSTPDINNEAAAATRIAALAVENATPTEIPPDYPVRPTATPLEGEATEGTPNFLPIMGLVLVVGGLFAALARRQFSK